MAGKSKKMQALFRKFRKQGMTFSDALSAAVGEMSKSKKKSGESDRIDNRGVAR